MGGQGEVLDALSKKEWMTTQQLSEIIGVGKSSLNRMLNILIKTGDIVCRDSRMDFGGQKPYFYKKI